MLSCVLPGNKACKRKTKDFNSLGNNNSSTQEDVQTITLPTANTLSTPKFPIVNRINGWLSSNQNAFGNLKVKEQQKLDRIRLQKIKKNEPKVGEVECFTDKINVVFIKNNRDKIFKLTFKTANCNVIPLYTRERPPVGKELDKKVQPYSKTYFYEEYTPHLTRFNTRRKAFRINHLGDDMNSTMSFKAKVGLQRTTEPKPKKKSVSISANKSNIQKSVIYLNVNNINFKLYPKMMTLDFCKPIFSDHSPFYKDLGLETHDQKKNKGSIVAKCNGDILKFTFNIEDINYQQIHEVVTRSCQIKDNSVYLKCYSDINSKIILISLPRNIYDYRDPMINIKRRNKYMQLHHIEPRWRLETRNKRIMAYKSCHEVDPSQKAYDSTTGSSIIYEGPGTLNKAKDGLITCEISQGDEDKYNMWIVQSQNETVNQVINDEDFETFETIGSLDVPDWDMVVYTK